MIDENLQANLTPEQYRVTQKQGTEAPFQGQYWDCHLPGIYVCIVCQQELFTAESKFDSGTGWPSFTTPIKDDAVETTTDSSHGMQRVEVHCQKCNAHLGHVFTDGPAPTGLRYCINSASLHLETEEN